MVRRFEQEYAEQQPGILFLLLLLLPVDHSKMAAIFLASQQPMLRLCYKMSITKTLHMPDLKWFSPLSMLLSCPWKKAVKWSRKIAMSVPEFQVRVVTYIIRVESSEEL